MNKDSITTIGPLGFRTVKTRLNESTFQVIEYDRYGDIYQKYQLKNGKMHGLYEQYFISGKLFKKCYYKNGKKNGFFVMYYPDGKLWKKGHYKDDVLDGPYLEYKEIGFLTDIQYILKRKGIYIQGQFFTGDMLLKAIDKNRQKFIEKLDHVSRMSRKQLIKEYKQLLVKNYRHKKSSKIRS